MAKKQTAGRDCLGRLAPKFAELNDLTLFGKIWSSVTMDIYNHTSKERVFAEMDKMDMAMVV